jgi:hypothetical protein
MIIITKTMVSNCRPAEQLGQYRQPLFETVITRRRPGPPNLTGSADDGHEQVLVPMCRPNGVEFTKR